MKKLVLGALTVSTLLLNNVSAKETLMDIHLTGVSSTVAEIDDTTRWCFDFCICV